jgi:hypothetical protein
MTLQRYRDWRPTGFDTAGLGLADRQDWLVGPVSRNRGSEGGTDYASILTESNFGVVLADLRTYDTDGEDSTIEVHRFGHWACGWFDIILVRPGTQAAEKAEEWAAFLSEVHPVASDEDLSERETEAQDRAWETASLRDRMVCLHRAGLPWIAARHSISDLHTRYHGSDRWDALTELLLSC